MTEILHKELSYAIVGAAMEVHRELGPAFLEAVYQKALACEFAQRDIPYEEQKLLPVFYKQPLVGDYKADFVIDGKIIAEIKSLSVLNATHQAQALHYLAATGMQLAILINFGAPTLEMKRVVR